MIEFFSSGVILTVSTGVLYEIRRNTKNGSGGFCN